MIVFNIQKYSLHDGSGIRTVVFCKGCPLRCRWCCNPESQQASPELIYRRSNCLGEAVCGRCKAAAPAGGISFDRERKAAPDYAICNANDLQWTSVCPTRALAIEGRELSVEEILKKAEEDEIFYRGGQGGLTLSGGEPLFQKDATALLQEAKRRHLHTAMETCAAVEPERFMEAAAYLDQVYIDIKSLDDEKHRAYTGVSNVRILQNLRILCDTYPQKEKIIRTPVIPGFNDSEEALQEIEGFVATLVGARWEKLPYHRYGVAKYAMLGRVYPLEDKGL